MRLGGLASLACVACEGPRDEPLPRITWEGTWLRYGSDPSVPATCKGTLPYMDAYVGTLLEELSLPDDGSKIDFFHREEESLVCTNSDALGCTRGSSIHSLVAPQEHELVHAVRAREGFGHGFVEEGAAELWGDDSRLFPFRSDTDGDVAQAIASADDGRLDGEYYGVAGRFAAYLVAQDGVGPFQQLLRETDRASASNDLARSFEAAYGETLETATANFVDYPLCDQEVFRSPIHTCTQARLVQWCVGGAAAELEETVACDDPETIGERDGEMWKYLAIDIEQAGLYTLFVYPDDSAAGSSIAVKSCEVGCDSFFQRIPVPTGIEPGTPLELGPGRYVLRLSRPSESPGAIRFMISTPTCP